MAKQKTTPNAKGQVKLREKALADGSKSLYLDINMNGKRHKEYLKLFQCSDKFPNACLGRNK